MKNTVVAPSVYAIISHERVVLEQSSPNASVDIPPDPDANAPCGENNVDYTSSTGNKLRACNRGSHSRELQIYFARTSQTSRVHILHIRSQLN